MWATQRVPWQMIAYLWSLLHFRYVSRKEVEKYFTELETDFIKLAALQLPMAEEMQVAILLVSLQENYDFCAFLHL